MPTGLQESLGENPFPCLFQLLETIDIPWLMAPPSIFKTSSVASSNLYVTLTLPSSFFTYKDLEIAYRAYPDNPGSSPHVRIGSVFTLLFSIDHPQAQWFISRSLSSLQISPLKTFLISVTVFFYFQHFSFDSQFPSPAEMTYLVLLVFQIFYQSFQYINHSYFKFFVSYNTCVMSMSGCDVFMSLGSVLLFLPFLKLSIFL